MDIVKLIKIMEIEAEAKESLECTESRIYVKPPYTGVVNATNVEIDISKMIEKAYHDGFEDARQAFLDAISKCNCEEWIKADIGASIEALS